MVLILSADEADFSISLLVVDEAYEIDDVLVYLVLLPYLAYEFVFVLTFPFVSHYSICASYRVLCMQLPAHTFLCKSNGFTNFLDGIL